jgi:glutathione-specific gamma-glutamylcyclotransferase
MNTSTHNVFGYGSLLWNPGFNYSQVRKVWLPDWSRRMWQGSTDHRGTSEFPGLVCTLVPDPGQGCWGLAYVVSDPEWPEIRAQLDHREKDGYQLRNLTAQSDQEPIHCWTYVADATNPSYIGDRPAQELAWRMARASGESGPNADYLLRLHQTLMQLEIEDPHIAELAALLTETDR